MSESPPQTAVSDAADAMIDARGKLCPWPLLMTKQALARLANGAELLILADDPMAELDLRAYCQNLGHQLLHLQISDAGLLQARILKTI